MTVQPQALVPFRKIWFTAQFQMAFCGYLRDMLRFYSPKWNCSDLKFIQRQVWIFFPNSKSQPLLNQNQKSSVLLAALHTSSSKQLKTSLCLVLAQLIPSFPKKLIISLWYFESSLYRTCHTWHLWHAFVQEMWWILQCLNLHARSWSWFLSSFSS